MIDPIVIHAAAASLAGILLLGALDKLRHFSMFQGAVAGYDLLPMGFVLPFAVLMVAGEALSGLLLLFPASRAVGGILAIAILLVATSGIAVNLLRGRTDIACGCGGLLEKSGGLTGWLIGRNGLLVGLAGLAMSASWAFVRTLEWVDGLTFFGTTLAVLGLYFSLNQLIDSHSRFQKS